MLTVAGVLPTRRSRFEAKAVADTPVPIGRGAGTENTISHDSGRPCLCGSMKEDRSLVLVGHQHATEAEKAIADAQTNPVSQGCRFHSLGNVLEVAQERWEARPETFHMLCQGKVKLQRCYQARW